VPIPGTQWAERFNGPANHNDWHPVMTIDSQGNVYVAAETKNTTPGPAYAVEAVNSAVSILMYLSAAGAHS
jgi:hypothetical protein